MEPKDENINISNVVSNVGDSYWVRLKIVGKTADIRIQANLVRTSDELVPYYLDAINKDFLGRPLTEYNQTLIHDIMDLIEYADSENGYIGTVLGVMSYRNISYNELVSELHGSFLETPAPLSSEELIQVQPIMMAIIIYALLGFMVYLAGRSPSYGIKREKVKKWFDEITTKPGKKEKSEAVAESYSSIKMETEA
ncbi:MAG: hypothetical protein ACTSRP_19495 [Candidatus Helarchaeota archaeon]